MKKILTTIVMAMLLMMTSANATNDRSATCSDTEVTELVLETTRETVIEQKGELASNQINIRLFDIRTVGHNEKLGSKV